MNVLYIAFALATAAVLAGAGLRALARRMPDPAWKATGIRQSADRYDETKALDGKRRAARHQLARLRLEARRSRRPQPTNVIPIAARKERSR